MTLEDLENKRQKQRCFYTKEEIIDILTGVSQKIVVDELPEEGVENYLYLVPTEEEGHYQQYVWSDGEWHDLGESEVDLTEYVTNPELDIILKDYDKVKVYTFSNNGSSSTDSYSGVITQPLSYNSGSFVDIKRDIQYGYSVYLNYDQTYVLLTKANDNNFIGQYIFNDYIYEFLLNKSGSTYTQTLKKIPIATTSIINSICV